MFLTVPAAELRPNDYCRGSRTKILGRPTAGVSTPAGKVDIKVQRRNGQIHYVTWSARTKIGIERTPE